MTFNFIDIWRSLLIGQSAMIVTWMILITWFRLRTKPRPGFVFGVVAFNLGNASAIAYIMIDTFMEIGQPSSYETLLVTLAILAEGLGCCLIMAHLFFNDELMNNRISSWFLHDVSKK